MSEVRFIITGACERALAQSIERCFPAGAASFTIAAQLDSFTSTPLTEPLSKGVVTLLDKFAARLLGEVQEHPEALVVGVDDLELNPDPTQLHNDPSQTTDALRGAITRQLTAFFSDERARGRCAAALAERCSFHLMVPMVEAYFFGEPAALTRAGAVRPSRFDPRTRDAEKFLVDDPDYLAAPIVPESAPREARKRSWAKDPSERKRHPKLYLKYLCSTPDAQGNADPLSDVYKEARGRGERAGFSGAEALSSLDWRQVTAFSEGAVFARSLIADIADYLAIRPSPIVGKEAPTTSRTTQRKQRVLRNL